MKLENNLTYRAIGKFDIKPIKDEISFLGEAVWKINETRQKEHGHHKETKNIFINDFPAGWNGNQYPLTKFFVSQKLNSLTDDIVSKLESRFNGKVGKSLYINLPAGKEVFLHRDYGYYLTGVHRCHIPIVTNDSVEFFLNGETVNMEAGVCYEIDNTNEHGVANKGDSDRIHLLVDIIPLKAFK